MLELAGELEMEVEASDGIVRVVESALSLPFTSWYWCGDNDLDHVGNDCVAGTGLVVGEVDPTCVLTVEADSARNEDNRAKIQKEHLHPFTF
jgi:hypothetical protein